MSRIIKHNEEPKSDFEPVNPVKTFQAENLVSAPVVIPIAEPVAPIPAEELPEATPVETAPSPEGPTDAPVEEAQS